MMETAYLQKDMGYQQAAMAIRQRLTYNKQIRSPAKGDD
jgi:hypothetical protein